VLPAISHLPLLAPTPAPALSLALACCHLPSAVSYSYSYSCSCPAVVSCSLFVSHRCRCWPLVTGNWPLPSPVVPVLAVAGRWSLITTGNCRSPVIPNAPSPPLVIPNAPSPPLVIPNAPPGAEGSRVVAQQQLAPVIDLWLDAGVEAAYTSGQISAFLGEAYGSRGLPDGALPGCVPERLSLP